MNKFNDWLMNIVVTSFSGMTSLAFQVSHIDSFETAVVAALVVFLVVVLVIVGLVVLLVQALNQ